MSLLRYASPGHTVVLVDEGPAVHVPRSSTFRANTTAGFIPFVRLPIVQSTAEAARQAARCEAAKARRAKT